MEQAVDDLMERAVAAHREDQGYPILGRRVSEVGGLHGSRRESDVIGHAARVELGRHRRPDATEGASACPRVGDDDDPLRTHQRLAIMRAPTTSTFRTRARGRR